MNQNKRTKGEQKELKLRKAYKIFCRNHNKDTYWYRIKDFRLFISKYNIRIS